MGGSNPVITNSPSFKSEVNLEKGTSRSFFFDIHPSGLGMEISFDKIKSITVNDVEQDIGDGLSPINLDVEITDDDILISAHYFTHQVPRLDADCLVTLADNTQKKFRDLNYGDLVKVWNFDEGKYDTAPILWKLDVKKSEDYWIITTETGRKINQINNHRFFCVDTNKFEKARELKGHTVWTVNGPEKVVSVKYVKEPIEYCNAISNYHMNLITEGFLTSIGFNNLYPIENMKYSYKEKRTRNTKPENWPFDSKYFYGIRVDEQYSPDNEIISYIKNLEKQLINA